MVCRFIPKAKNHPQRKEWFYHFKVPAKPGKTPSLLERYSREELLTKVVIQWQLQEENGKEARLFTVFDSWEKFVEYRNVFPAQTRTFYEVILGEQPQKLKFDIDLDRTNFPELTQKQFADGAYELVDHVVGICSQLIPSLTPEDVFLFESHHNTKFSVHVVLNNYHVDNNTIAGAFTAKVCEILSTLHTATWVNGIDLSVNKSLQMFRLFGCRKYGKKNDKAFFPLTDSHKELAERSMLEVLKLSSITCVDLTTSKLVSGFTPPKKKNKEIEEMVVAPELHQYALDCVNEYLECELYAFRGRAKGGRLTLNRIDKKRAYCKACRRVHESDNAYVVVCASGIFFGCFRNIRVGGGVNTVFLRSLPGKEVPVPPVARSVTPELADSETDDVEDLPTITTATLPKSYLRLDDLVIDDQTRKRYHCID